MENCRNITAIEIKAGATINPDFFKGLRNFQKILFCVVLSFLLAMSYLTKSLFFLLYFLAKLIVIFVIIQFINFLVHFFSHFTNNFS
jgi:hypothetical protein